MMVELIFHVDICRYKKFFEDYCYPLSEDLYVMWESDPDSWKPINHSCDPNSWYEQITHPLTYCILLLLLLL